MSLDCLPEYSVFTVTGISTFSSTSLVLVGRQSGLSLPLLFFFLQYQVLQVALYGPQQKIHFNVKKYLPQNTMSLFSPKLPLFSQSYTDFTLRRVLKKHYIICKRAEILAFRTKECLTTVQHSKSSYLGGLGSFCFCKIVFISDKDCGLG